MGKEQGHYIIQPFDLLYALFVRQLSEHWDLIAHGVKPLLHATQVNLFKLFSRQEISLVVTSVNIARGVVE